MTTDNERQFYAWDDCHRCNGTGWVPIAECLCQLCRRRYVEELEKIIASFADANDYSNPVAVFAVYTVYKRNEREQS